MARKRERRVVRTELCWRWWDSQEEIQVRFPREQPAEPEVGSGWFNEASRCFCVWDGREWVSLPLD